MAKKRNPATVANARNQDLKRGSSRPGPRESQVEVAPELVFGLVGALGTDLPTVCTYLERALNTVNYAGHSIRIIEGVHAFPKWAKLEEQKVDKRTASHMKAGSAFRALVEEEAAVAILGVVEIARLRKEWKTKGKLSPRQAWILRSLKNPHEVRELRRIYGEHFVLISCYAPLDVRHQNMAVRIAESYGRLQPSKRDNENAQKLIEIDETEYKPYGQNVQQAFPLADLFIDVSAGEHVQIAIQRFVNLLFGNWFITPTRDEHAMALSSIASLRSAAIGRQVGACLTTEEGEVISVGTNEVPKSGGGSYWEGDEPDERDFQWGYDTTEEMKRQNLLEVLEALANHGWLKETKNIESLSEKALPALRRTRLMNPIEFGRCEHAEQSALFDAARRGVAVKGSVLYTTTFPCHECARHIVTAGVTRVVYIEPYPKSLAPTLHKDSIVLEPQSADSRVRFEPFVGVAPRRYQILYTALARKDENGKLLKWDPKAAEPRLRDATRSIADDEAYSIIKQNKKLQSKIGNSPKKVRRSAP